MKKFEIGQKVYLSNGIIGRYVEYLPEHKKHLVNTTYYGRYNENELKDTEYAYLLISDSEIYPDVSELKIQMCKELQQAKTTKKQIQKDIKNLENKKEKLKDEIKELKRTKTDFSKLVINKTEWLKEVWFWPENYPVPFRGKIDGFSFRFEGENDPVVIPYVKMNENIYYLDTVYLPIPTDSITKEKVIEITQERILRSHRFQEMLDQIEDEWLSEKLLKRKREILTQKQKEYRAELLQRRHTIQSELNKVEKFLDETKE